MTKINAVLCQHSVRQTFAWLVYVGTHCEPIATLNQNNRTLVTPTLFSHAQISPKWLLNCLPLLNEFCYKDTRSELYKKQSVQKFNLENSQKIWKCKYYSATWHINNLLSFSCQKRSDNEKLAKIQCLDSVVYMKELEIVAVIDATSSCEKKAWKKFRLVRDSNPWPLRYRCSALPIEFTSQLGASRWIGSLWNPWKNRWWWSYEYMKIIYENCDDLLSYNSSPRSSHIWFSYINNFTLLYTHLETFQSGSF